MMKYLVSFLFLLALVITGCGGSSGSATAKAEAPKLAPAPDVVIIADFEDAANKIITYAGPKSVIKADFSKEKVHGGTQSCKVENNTADWAGALVSLSEANNNWTGSKTFRMWVFGSKSGNAFNVDIEESGSEQLRYTLSDDFAGWKEIVVPLSEFKSRTDWQADGAAVNGKLDMPMKSVQFCTTTLGQFTVYIDDISITKN